METNHSIPFIDEIKAHFDLTDFAEETDGLPIHGHFIFILPIATQNSPVLLLSTSVCECTSQDDAEHKIKAVMRLQQETFLDKQYAFALEPEERFFTLQKIVFPDDAQAACKAIEEFARDASVAEQSLALSMDTLSEN